METSIKQELQSILFIPRSIKYDQLNGLGSLPQYLQPICGGGEFDEYQMKHSIGISISLKRFLDWFYYHIFFK